MKKIRIGNDIRLKLTIDGISNLDQSNIKQLRCYLVNTTLGKDEDEARKKHARRFTREVFPEFYIPSEYNLHGCCHQAYHVHPVNVCHYDHFLPDFHEYHWWPGFKGFGVYPDKFERYHRFWHPLPHLEHYEHPFITGPDRKPEAWYLADSEVLNTTNTASCLFPADHQHFCGVYKLVIVLTLFEHGWGKHNLRTYTIDKGEVFELVDDYTGESGNITISIDDTGSRENVINTIKSENNIYTLIGGDIMRLGDADIDNKIYNIYVQLKDNTQVVFNPYDWRFNGLLFSSSDETVLRVDVDGCIYTYPVPEGEDQRQVTVYVQDEDDTDVKHEFKVIVKNSDTALKMGFSKAETVSAIEDSELAYYDAQQSFDYSVTNDEAGKYLWILTQREIDNVASSGFYVPLLDPVVKDGFYAYRSAAAILEGEMKFVIKYKYYEQ